jgi:glyoxylase-like metal-dependent hydrolase (beta-lactamase superfamily II)
MQVIPLSEGAFTIDKTKLFVPFNEDLDNLQERAKGSLLVEVQPFLVISSEDVIVIDAGLGFTNDGTLQIHSNLAANGINPEDVTKVLMSHLHKDHAGGMSMEQDGKRVPAFPEATYYVQKQELDFALEPSPSYIREEIEFLKDAPFVKLLEGNGVIDGYIKYELTGAHSPFHQVFTLVDGGERVFYGGDDAPQLQQMKSRFVAKYDYDGKKCMELRQKWWKEGEQEKWTFLFYHDVKNAVFSF